MILKFTVFSLFSLILLAVTSTSLTSNQQWVIVPFLGICFAISLGCLVVKEFDIK